VNAKQFEQELNEAERAVFWGFFWAVVFVILMGISLSFAHKGDHDRAAQDTPLAEKPK